MRWHGCSYCHNKKDKEEFVAVGIWDDKYTGLSCVDLWAGKWQFFFVCDSTTMRVLVACVNYVLVGGGGVLFLCYTEMEMDPMGK